MSKTYFVAVDGITLDEIVFEYYGASSGYVEAVLRVNPGLVLQGAKLARGTYVLLPDLPTTTKDNSSSNEVRLWS